MSIRIREAQPADADAIAAAHVEGWRSGYRGVVPDEYLDGSEFRDSRLALWRGWEWANWRPMSTLYSALFDDEVVGFGHVGEAFDRNDQPLGVGEVYGFYLHPAVWGTGAASALISACERRLIEFGYTNAVLYALRDNPRGRRFYEKSGWTYDPTGDGIFETGDGLLSIADVRYRRELSLSL